jgi:predicted enzyme related to lactoylglutathione lyase
VTTPKPNAVGYFEIPVSDLERAQRFYTAVFEVDLERTVIDGYVMALFPLDPDAPGAGGALAKGDVYIPGKAGPVLYFSVPDIDAVLARATKLGAMVLYEKKSIGENGFVAEIEDSEGNRIALHARVD